MPEFRARLAPLLAALLLIFSPAASGDPSSTDFTVDDAFPGGNIVVDSIAGNTVYLHQDLTDFGPGNWFYWYFAVSGASGKTLTFEFTHPWGAERKRLNVLGVRGPAVSLDGGATWEWLGADSVEGTSFTYSFGEKQEAVRFSFGMPYTAADFNAFIESYRGDLHVDLGTLAITRAGRRVERLHVGRIHGNARYRIVITARHHASEMMANYVLEGIIQHILEDQDGGRWFRENVEALMVPFMDTDGVEEGEQGKNRKGRDHNQDYTRNSLYASTAALRNYVPIWAKGKLVAGIDLHCPWVRGGAHERIHQVGSDIQTIWREQQEFGRLLEKATANSALSYFSSSDLVFGTSWNTTAGGSRFRDWVATIDGVSMATTLEIPYANASGKAVTQQSARLFGRDLAAALIRYLQSQDGG